MSSKNSRLLTLIGLAVAALALIGLAWWLVPGLIVFFWGIGRLLFMPFLIGFAVFIVITVGAHKLFGASLSGAAVGGAIIGGLVFCVMAFVFSYQRGQIYADSIKVKEMDEKASQLPNFAQRQPFTVAEQVSNRTLGDSTGDATGVLKAIPSKEVFTTTVRKRGFLAGYESTQMVKVSPFGTTPNSNVTFCSYSDQAGKRLTSTFIFNSLGRDIRHKVGLNTTFDSDDAFVVCEQEGKDSVPQVYVPLKKRVGFFNPTSTFGGVAIYNGKTGELKVEKDYDGEYPVYPASLEMVQRDATKYSGSFSDYFFKRVGFEDTEKDENDPNKPYNSDFVLADTELKDSYYVTPLTPRGNSDSIVALGVLEGTSDLKAGHRKDFVVYKYAKGKSHAANSSVSASITGDILSGYKSSGLDVFEVIPAEDGTWTASVGKDQTVVYRAKISRDGYITLFDAHGKVVGTNEPNKEVDKTADTPEKKGDKADGRKDVSQMSDEEIKELVNEGIDELIRRGADPAK